MKMAKKSRIVLFFKKKEQIFFSFLRQSVNINLKSKKQFLKRQQNPSLYEK